MTLAMYFQLTNIRYKKYQVHEETYVIEKLKDEIVILKEDINKYNYQNKIG